MQVSCSDGSTVFEGAFARRDSCTAFLANNVSLIYVECRGADGCGILVGLDLRPFSVARRAKVHSLMFKVEPLEHKEGSGAAHHV